MRGFKTLFGLLSSQIATCWKLQNSCELKEGKGGGKEMLF